MKRAGAALASVSLALLLAAAAPAPAPLLRAEGWTSADANRAHVLTHAPQECLARRDDAVEAGRALFRSPGLLGGPAARIGLSCEACHAGGRVNAHFHLPELSGAPGTADVTSEWTSKTRGDGVFNPVPIPDLLHTPAKATFGAARVGSLEAFVRGVIVDEFQGSPPSPAVIAALLAYLGARDPACGDESVRITLTDAADDVRRAFAASRRASAARDAATASLLLYATQDAVGRIVERLPGRLFARDRATLEQLASELTGLRADPALLAARLSDADVSWRARFDAALSRIARHGRATLFDERTLAGAYALRSRGAPRPRTGESGAGR